MRYMGICQCGSAAFEVEAEPGAAGIAAASTRRDGLGAGGNALLWPVPRARLRLLSSEEGIGAYTFSGRIVGHRFCRTCGVHLYGEELNGTGGRMAFVNPDCVEGVEGIEGIEFVS